MVKFSFNFFQKSLSFKLKTSYLIRFAMKHTDGTSRGLEAIASGAECIWSSRRCIGPLVSTYLPPDPPQANDLRKRHWLGYHRYAPLTSRHALGGEYNENTETGKVPATGPDQADPQSKPMPEAARHLSYSKRFCLPMNPVRRLAGAFAQLDISIKSKLVIVKLAGLEQTTDLHGTRAFLVLGILSGLFAVFSEELSVVAGKFLERDEEVAEDKLEFGQVLGALEEVGDEGGDLVGAKVGECVGEQVGHEVLEEVLIRHAGSTSVLRIDRALNLASAYKPEHAGEQHGLVLETSLVVGVSEHEEDILENGGVEALEEGVASLGVGVLCHVADKLDAHVQTLTLDSTVIVLRCPHAAVDDKLEVSLIKSKQCREAALVDLPEKLEEFHAVLGVLGEVLVDHVQGALEDSVEDRRYLFGHHAL